MCFKVPLFTVDNSSLIQSGTLCWAFVWELFTAKFNSLNYQCITIDLDFIILKISFLLIEFYYLYFSLIVFLVIAKNQYSFFSNTHFVIKSLNFIALVNLPVFLIFIDMIFPKLVTDFLKTIDIVINLTFKYLLFILNIISFDSFKFSLG